MKKGIVNPLTLPGVAGVADLAIGYSRAFVTACQALEKIATGSSGKDTSATAQTMRDIAMEALVAVRYGPYGDGKRPSGGYTLDEISEAVAAEALEQEEAWLIENKVPDEAAPTYWFVHKGHPMFTDDHRLACRFSRKEDADQIRELVVPGEYIKSVWHGWAA